MPVLSFAALRAQCTATKIAVTLEKRLLGKSYEMRGGQFIKQLLCFLND